MTIFLDDIELSNDLVWSDQYNWSPVHQTTSRAVDGTLIVEVGTKLKGRRISLVGESNVGWMPRSVIESVYSKASTAGLVMTLNYKGFSTSVIFDHENEAIEVEQAMGYCNPQSNDWIRVKAIRFITV